MNHPDVTSLYKYRPFNQYSLQGLINQVAWYERPAMFNDPFDCAISLDESRMDESILKAIRDGQEATGKHESEMPANFYEIQETDRVAFRTYRQSVLARVQTIGVFCLSEVCDDILMWAHYADSHKGFCIEYERTSTNELGKEAEKVVYQQQISSLLGSDVTSSGGGIAKLWLTKSEHWSYEKEWRLMQTKGGTAFQFPCKVKSIIFGMRMTAVDRRTIERIMEGRNVCFREAQKDDTKYALKVSVV